MDCCGNGCCSNPTLARPGIEPETQRLEAQSTTSELWPCPNHCWEAHQAGPFWYSQEKCNREEVGSLSNNSSGCRLVKLST